MYIYKSDLLVNQQKFRRVVSKINKNHWCSKSLKTNTCNFYVLSDYQTIDLRLYKFMLRRLKKKLLKFKIESYVYLFPNNKTSHKSKNSRMGKGKGLNNRFYFRCKRARPLVVFKNFSTLRFFKLRCFFSKFFAYKIS